MYCIYLLKRNNIKIHEMDNVSSKIATFMKFVQNDHRAVLISNIFTKKVNFLLNTFCNYNHFHSQKKGCHGIFTLAEQLMKTDIFLKII
jgi:hypothetical protein